MDTMGGYVNPDRPLAAAGKFARGAYSNSVPQPRPGQTWDPVQCTQKDDPFDGEDFKDGEHLYVEKINATDRTARCYRPDMFRMATQAAPGKHPLHSAPGFQWPDALGPKPEAPKTYSLAGNHELQVDVRTPAPTPAWVTTQLDLIFRDIGQSPDRVYRLQIPYTEEGQASEHFYSSGQAATIRLSAGFGGFNGFELASVQADHPPGTATPQALYAAALQQGHAEKKEGALVIYQGRLMWSNTW